MEKVCLFEIRVGPKKLLIQYAKTSNILVIRNSLYESNTALMRQTEIKIYRALWQDTYIDFKNMGNIDLNKGVGMLKRCRRFMCFLFYVLITTVMAYAQPGPDRALDAINDHTLRAHICFLGDDLLGGRAPGSAGSVLAQRYIASQMQLSGLKPGIEDSSYYQKFDVVEINTKPEMQLTISGKN